MSKIALRKQADQQQLQFEIPSDIQDLLGKPPLLKHENKDHYFELMRRLASTTRPNDFIEWLWVRDVADLTWEIIRWRRLKAALMNAGRQRAIEHFVCISAPGLMDSVDASDPAILAEEWFTNPASKNDVDELLAKRELDADSIAAQCFAQARAELETAERLLAACEIRRNDALNEIGRRQQAFGRALHRASDDVVDAEISAPPVPKKVAA
jgi:hypothetical protein